MLNITDIVIAVYNSTFFAVIKFLIGIYIIVMLVNIVLLLLQRGLGGNIRSTMIGMNVPPELVAKKKKLRKKWEQLVREKLKSNKEEDYKAAVIAADEIIDDLLKRIGYKEGQNMEERLNVIPPGQIEDAAVLKKAHETRKQIDSRKDFSLTKEKALEVVKLYEEFLKTYEVLE